jgi:DNA-binding response OmpR family regulator
LDDVQSAAHFAAGSESYHITFGHYDLSPLHKELTDCLTGTPIKLTEKEVAVIRYLYNNTDRIVDKTELLREVWGYHPDASTHTIETHIYRLRQKVERDNTSAPFILTEDGGYKLNNESSNV